MIATCDKYAERRGSENWYSRGSEGSWLRVHSTPRRSFFTPCRVPRGPAHPDELSGHRFTVGININGQSFKIQDDWTDAVDSHRVLELPWTGTTTFANKKWRGREVLLTLINVGLITTRSRSCCRVLVSLKLACLLQFVNP